MVSFFILFAPTFVPGFLLSLLARTWTQLVLSFFAWTCLFLLTLASFESGFTMFIFAAPLTFVACGAVIGHLTRAVLLATRLRLSSKSGRFIALAGLLLLPVATLLFAQYRDWRSRTLYAALPQASTLPQIPACLPFRQAGSLLDTTINWQPYGTKGAEPPRRSIKLRYPGNYLDGHKPFIPKPWTTSWLSFEMRLDSPLPVERDEEGGRGKTSLSILERRSKVRFRIVADSPAADKLALALNRDMRPLAEIRHLPGLMLEETTMPGLSRVMNKPSWSYDESSLYVSRRGSEIVDYLRCNGRISVPNPQCEFTIDASDLPVAGWFPVRALPQWPTLRANVRNFVECSVLAGKD